jgi:hypothetical protein
MHRTRYRTSSSPTVRCRTTHGSPAAVSAARLLSSTSVSCHCWSTMSVISLPSPRRSFEPLECRALSAARMSSASASHRRVEPSISVNSKVTTPEGVPPRTPHRMSHKAPFNAAIETDFRGSIMSSISRLLLVPLGPGRFGRIRRPRCRRGSSPDPSSSCNLSTRGAPGRRLGRERHRRHRRRPGTPTAT